MRDLLEQSPADILSHHADAEAVDSFIDYRRRHKRAALTVRGAAMIAKTLMDINASGGCATEALDMAQEHGWQTIKASWYWRNKTDEQRYIAGQATQRPDPALEQMLRLGGVVATPGVDRI